MFVNNKETTYTYMHTREAKWIKITYLKNEIRLSNILSIFL